MKVHKLLILLLLLSVVDRHMWRNPQECVIPVARFISSCWLLRPQSNFGIIQWISVCFNCCVYVSLVLCLPALEAERVFGVVSFLMAVSTGVLCLVFALWWTSRTVRSYSNTRSLLMAGQALYPTTLLLLTMGSTGNCSKYDKTLVCLGQSHCVSLCKFSVVGLEVLKLK